MPPLRAVCRGADMSLYPLNTGTKPHTGSSYLKLLYMHHFYTWLKTLSNATPRDNQFKTDKQQSGWFLAGTSRCLCHCSCFFKFRPYFLKAPLPSCHKKAFEPLHPTSWGRLVFSFTLLKRMNIFKAFFSICFSILTPSAIVRNSQKLSNPF